MKTKQGKKGEKWTEPALIKELLRLGVQSHERFADVEYISIKADELLLEFIGSKAITEAYRSVRHY